ncbi:Unconventional Myosin-X [Manis pentadactyla]|nr:Unconventional Myosin-X [Manis pentadactyla]
MGRRQVKKACPSPVIFIKKPHKASKVGMKDSVIPAPPSAEDANKVSPTEEENRDHGSNHEGRQGSGNGETSARLKATRAELKSTSSSAVREFYSRHCQGWNTDMKFVVAADRSDTFWEELQEEPGKEHVHTRYMERQTTPAPEVEELLKLN